MQFSELSCHSMSNSLYEQKCSSLSNGVIQWATMQFNEQECSSVSKCAIQWGKIQLNEKECSSVSSCAVQFLIVLFHNYFSPSNECISACKSEQPSALYSNISQTLLLYKTLYHKKIDHEILGVYYWYVKIPQGGYMEHGLKCFMFKKI